MLKKTILIFAIIALLAIPASATYQNPWGGIPGTPTTPPEGTHINNGLSQYYNMPIAVGNGCTYWYAIGFWYTYEDFFNLPCELFMYGCFPHGGNTNMPINTFVPIAFAFVALVIFYKR